jgi:hypothetical protein
MIHLTQKRSAGSRVALGVWIASIGLLVASLGIATRSDSLCHWRVIVTLAVLGYIGNIAASVMYLRFGESWILSIAQLIVTSVLISFCMIDVGRILEFKNENAEPAGYMGLMAGLVSLVSMLVQVYRACVKRLSRRHQ